MVMPAEKQILRHLLLSSQR